MKKLLLFFALVISVSCSSEDEDSDEMCCGTPISVLIENYHKFYTELLEKENLSEEQKTDINLQYDKAIEDPCGTYKKQLEFQGASCANPD